MTTQTMLNPTSSSSANADASHSRPNVITLQCEQAVGHADHWSCFSQDIPNDIPNWLQQHIDVATIPKALVTTNKPLPQLLLSGNEPIHLNQIIQVDTNRKPERFVNAFPCVNSPYGQWVTIEAIYRCDENVEAILRLKTDDDTILYAFDQFYAINEQTYERGVRYYANLSAIAYEVKLSNRDEVIVVDDPEAIRYHRAFNDILTQHQGKAPKDLDAQIAAWQPDPADLPLAPVEINVGDMCAYLFGDTIGQQDEAWCQGQVIGKQTVQFNDIDFTLLDVVILRETLDNPVVIRMAVNQDHLPDNIKVNDYIQANIWLQATIFQENQTRSQT